MTTAVKPRQIGVSLFVQVIALMVGALLAAQVLSLVVVFFFLPPPQPLTYQLSDIIRVYQGMPQLAQDKPPLVVKLLKNRPPPLRDTAIDRASWLRSIVATEVSPAVESEDVVVRTDFNRWFRDPSLNKALLEARATSQPFVVAPFSVSVRQPDGQWKEVSSSITLVLDRRQQGYLVWFVALFFAVAGAAYILARRLSSPLTSFAQAAERLGRDPTAPPLEIRGSTEIATAATAFNEMQQRLRRYVEDRTAMIGAIAHDLRTPLTRLRFRIESAPDEVRGKMSDDLDEMEAMIAATLAFVRDTNQPAQRKRLELSSLLESQADEMAETGADTTVESSEKVIIDGDPIALKRLFSNLIGNAIKYGKSARVRVRRDGDFAIVEVDDDGPGVPPEEFERVFEPFYRREPSRNRDTGGIGLGLAVVRTIARSHGGDAELENRPSGGLTARVKLPL